MTMNYFDINAILNADFGFLFFISLAILRLSAVCSSLSSFIKEELSSSLIDE